MLNSISKRIGVVSTNWLPNWFWVFLTLLVWVSIVTALSKRNSPCAAILGEDAKVHCQLNVDSFTIPLHSPNGRRLPVVRAIQRDCHWDLKNGGNSHRSREPIMQWGTRQSQSIFRPTNHKSVIPTGGHVPYPTDSPIATRLGLCSRLIVGWNYNFRF